LTRPRAQIIVVRLADELALTLPEGAVPAPEAVRPSIVAQWSSEPNLDALRAFAVLCVVARHLASMFDVPASAWFQPQALGTFGVVIFFVHTSLVLMLSLDRQQARQPGSKGSLYAAFLVRRFFRIYPLSVAAVLIIYFAVFPFTDANAPRAGLGTDATPRDLVANLLLVHDVVGTRLIEIPLWSLPAEVQMYLVLPALYFLARARGLKFFLAVVWPAAVVVALAWKHLGLHAWAGYYAPCFVAGVLCYLALGARRALPFWILPLALVAILVAYMGAYARVGLQAGLGIPATIALAALLPRFAPMRALWLRRATHTVAKYSYGIYLFHSPCIWLAFGKLGFLGLAGASVVFVLLTTVVVVVAYHALEAPLIAVGQRIARRL
jgi:peptidoglycan/LPS O-acetylase OafA/YrhL